MNQGFRFCILLFFLFCNSAYSQSNFKKEWVENDPVRPGDFILTTEKLKVHADYLKNAVSRNDITRQFYGVLYLFTDHMDAQNYSEASTYLIRAENIAAGSNSKKWKGFVKLQSGWMNFIVNDNMQAALKEFRLALMFFEEAKDSLGVGESFLNIGAVYSTMIITEKNNHTENLDSGTYYFALALPILRRFPNSNMAAAFNSYSNFLSYQRKYKDVLIYNDSAISIAVKEKNVRKATAYLTNRGTLFYDLGQYDSALNTLKKCAAVNIENKWFDNLRYDYYFIALSYKEKRQFEAAYEYIDKYYSLRDSLSGSAVKLKIAGLTAKNENQQKQIEVADIKLSLERKKRIIIIGLFLIALIVALWLIQRKRSILEKLQNKESLAKLTRMLLEKNILLTDLEEKLSAKQIENEKPGGAENPETNLYNQRILTNEDWSDFKTYFEKVYPGYLLRLRNSFPDITESEERLFLFLKLKLNNKEVAAMLGISTDSVKKTRNRLRKRLDLNEEMSLEKYVMAF